jgi:hypothetical protein
MTITRVLWSLGLLWLAGCAGGTHLGQASADHVVLESANGDTGCTVSSAGTTFRRTFHDGNGALQPFQMPADKSLVITDVDWLYHHPTGAAAADSRVVLRVFVQNLADPTQRERVLESTIVLNGAGEGGTSEAMTTGFVVAPTAQLCVDTGVNPKGPPSGLQHMILRGYFIAAT